MPQFVYLMLLRREIDKCKPRVMEYGRNDINSNRAFTIYNSLENWPLYMKFTIHLLLHDTDFAI